MSSKWFNSPSKGTPRHATTAGKQATRPGAINAGAVHFLFPKRPAASMRAIQLLSRVKDRTGQAIDIPAKPAAYRRAIEQFTSSGESPFSTFGAPGNRPFPAIRHNR